MPIVILLQQMFRKMAGHLNTCDRETRTATRCDCGFISTLMKCAYNTKPCGCRGEPDVLYEPLRDLKPQKLIDITAVLEDSVRRCKEMDRAAANAAGSGVLSGGADDETAQKATA